MYSETLICVNDINRRSDAVVAALQFAERFSGSVTAIYIKLDAVELMRWQGASPMELANQLLTDLDKKESDAKRKFEALSSQYGCETIWRTVSQSEEPIQQMLCADLIFAEQPMKDDQNYPSHQSFLNHVILETKRPIMMIPNGWKQAAFTTPNKIVLGWNSSAESMRAAGDALPLMEMCEEVIILEILTDKVFKKESQGLYHIQDYLTRKKIANELIIDGCEKAGAIPATFLKRAITEQADLIVVGGYGHSRLRELILGGMTDYLIKNSSVPMLFSH